MNLYEITNGHQGNSFVRVYAWAESEKQALGMASEQFRESDYSSRQLKIRFLFAGYDASFCTTPSDSGFENIPYVPILGTVAPNLGTERQVFEL